MLQRLFNLITAVCVAALVAACGGSPTRNDDHATVNPPVIATITNVRPHQATTQTPSGVNTAAGAVVGGLLGNQVGKGKGKVAATLAGVVGGAMVGSQINQNTKVVDMEELTLAMPDGRSIQVDVNAAGFRPGQRVQLMMHGKQVDIKALP